MNDPQRPCFVPARATPPSTNGYARRNGTSPERRTCPSCGAAGVRFLRSTGRWHRDPSGGSTFGYVTFCAACGHDYGETVAG
jgi:C4-type Zn-finger protein